MRATAAALMLICSCLASRAGAAPDEYALKAAYLYNFVKYVSWPEQAFAGPEAPFRICVIGRDPFGPRLDVALRDKRVRKRSFEVLRLPAPPAERPGCHVLFVAASEGPRARRLLARTADPWTLSIGERPGLAREVSIANFAATPSGFAVELNAARAVERGLEIDARLRQVARSVGPEAPAAPEETP